MDARLRWAGVHNYCTCQSPRWSCRPTITWLVIIADNVITYLPCWWTYFRYCAVKDKNVCIVKNKSGSECGKELTGKNTRNLKNYLSRLHVSEYDTVIEKKLSVVVTLQCITALTLPSRCIIRVFYCSKNIFITLRAMDIIYSPYYSQPLRWWKYFCCFICVTLLWALHIVIKLQFF